jgi:hypothetical protein
MKGFAHLFALIIVLFACSNPDKEKINEADSLQNKRPILADTVNMDTLTAKSVFNKEDS